MKQQLLSTLFIALLTPLGAWAALGVGDTFAVGGITYKVTSTNPQEVQVGDGKNIAVSTGTTGAINIPATVTGTDAISYAVTSIGDYSFYQVTGMTSVTIPSSVKSIVKYAFYGCKGLAAVHITDLAAWCNMDFQHDGMKILIRNGRPVDYYNPLFYAPLFVNGTEVTDLVIPSSVTSISDNVFTCSQTIRSVTIGNNVTTIGSAAFSNCINLTSLSLGNSVKTIGSSAFYSCSSLPSVIIPSLVDSIGASAFGSCPALSVIKVENGNKTFDSRNNSNAIIKTATNMLIQGCKSTTIPTTVTAIGRSAFRDCNGITTIVIPNSVKDIGSYAFEGCTALASVTIPNSVGNIGSYAFEGCTALTSVTIPASVSEINNYTFSGCKSLVSVSIPSSVTSIGEEAFYSCSILRAINIPQSVNIIGKEAFAYCDSLASITVESDNAVYDSRENCNAIIETATNTLIQGCKTTAIPASTVAIGGSAFKGTGLQAITIPNGVTSIGTMAFYGCNRLTTVTIPASVTSIGQMAFAYCYGVKEWQSLITEPFTISDNTFNNCYDVPLYVPIGTEAKYRSTAGWNKFSTIIENDPNSSVKISDVFSADGITYKVLGNSPLTVQVGLGEQKTQAIDATTEGAIVIPSSVSDEKGNHFTVTMIVPYAFAQCNKLTEVTIPESVTDIGLSAFNNCYNLETATIHAKLTTIENNTFSGCTKLRDISIPASVTSIKTSAFANCRTLTSLTIPASVTSIGQGAFNGCYGVTSLTIPASVTSIGQGAFNGCYGLTAIKVDSRNTVYDSRDNCNAIIVTLSGGLLQGCSSTVIPGTVTSIEPSSFYNCRNLTSVTIPASVKSIGQSAFSGCIALTTINIPSSVTSVGQYAFNGCNALATITSQITEPYAITKNVFSDNIYANCLLSIPADTREKYLALEGWKEFKNIAEPASEGGVFISGGITYRIESLSELTAAVGDGNRAAIAIGTSGSLSIPSAVTHPGSGIRLTVTGVSSRAFAGCTWLTSITLPATLTAIGTGAFQGCTGLGEVRPMMRKPMAIGTDVFSNYSIPLYVPAGTKADYMAASGWRLFAVIQELKALSEGESFVADDITYKVISTNPLEVQVGIGTDSNQRAIDQNKTGTLFIPSTVSGSDGNQYAVVNIGQYAFNNCRISAAIIPDGVTQISKNAFFACKNMTSIYIPGSVDTIEDNAFWLSGLTSLVFPDGLTNIGNGSFRECTGLTSIAIPASVTSIGKWVFGGCTGLTSITVDAENSVYDSRGGCNAIIKKNNGSWDRDYLIAGCAKTVIPNDVRGIADDAFYKVENLTSITIPSTVTFIGNDAFNGCTGLRSISLPKVEIMYMRAFANCTGLTSVTIPATARHISETVFMGCSGLKSIKVDKDNTTFETNGRYNAIVHVANKKLLAACKNTVIPDYVTVIDNSAFYGCTGLKSITLPAGLTSIGSFTSCTALIEVVSKIAEPFAIGDIFSQKTYGGMLKVPVGTKAKYEATDGWKNFTNIVETDFKEEPQGDVNGDSTVDVADIASVISVMASSTEPQSGTAPNPADVNGDGVVDVADIATIISEMAAQARMQ